MYRSISLLLAASGLLTACSVEIKAGMPNAPVPAPTTSTPVASADLDRSIHDYLIAHPEVISEAQRALGVRQAAEQKERLKVALTANSQQVFNDPADPVLGNPQGDVTVVEFFDDRCPFCKAVTPTIDDLIKHDPNVRVVLKEFPILGPVSEAAARYAMAAQQQGLAKYAAFHHALMTDGTSEQDLTEAHVLEIAQSAGLDVAKMKVDAGAADIKTRIGATRALAQKLGVTGTPALVIGDQVRGGAMSLPDLEAAVKQARAALHSAS